MSNKNTNDWIQRSVARSQDRRNDCFCHVQVCTTVKKDPAIIGRTESAHHTFAATNHHGGLGHLEERHKSIENIYRGFIDADAKKSFLVPSNERPLSFSFGCESRVQRVAKPSNYVHRSQITDRPVSGREAQTQLLFVHHRFSKASEMPNARVRPRLEWCVLRAPQDLVLLHLQWRCFCAHAVRHNIPEGFSQRNHPTRQLSAVRRKYP
ncbi:hypothetical protein XU18_0923 [Perkinsela sp. CCAP 1560/4]|nr:hypothetical protein XU18_0923 [Perkinsela sp. CCAP 1560/4]|eukprot:KNH08580.1 hypothetical protein XU18_0923 [Perkinsela sp. CCAP 1560/4]